MSSKDQVANDPKFHSNTVGQSLAAGAQASAITLHNADSAGQGSGVASVNDTTSSDANSAAAVNKGPQAKAVQVNVSGCRLSNPA